jgi:Ca-activated chloride channel family protein
MKSLTICGGALFLGLFASTARAQPIATERLEAVMIAGGETRSIPMGEERLSVTIDGQHATTTLLQVYENPGSSAIEGQYHLRPGTGSHVEGFAYWNGEQKIVGEVFERQTARQVYDNVTARRRDPGLLEEDGEGRFSFKVFPINPREKKRVELRWTKWLERRGQTVHYRAPITRADADIVIQLVGPVKNVRSSTHRLRTEKIDGGVRVRSDGGRSATELAIDYDVDELEWTPSAYVQPGGKDEGWFALSLAAAGMPANAIAPKDVTIVIDRSGSMIGEPLAHAKAAASNMIRLLSSNDRVNVISFSDEVDPLFKAPQALDADTRARAIRFVDKLNEGGGTDIALALSTAITSQEKKTERPRVVVFLTDGQSDVDKAIQAARTDTGDVRLFTLGLGKDVNKPLLSRLAALKRGRFVYIEKASSIESEVGRLAASISKPLLVGVSIDVEGAQAMRLYPRSIPDLFADDQLLVTGRLRGTGTAKFTIRGTLGGKAVAFTRSVDLSKAPRRPWVGSMWAQSRVDHILEELSLGAKPTELVEEVIGLALAYNFVTPYTAFLAIPESELGAMADTVAKARERKRKVMAQNPDAASLKNGGQPQTAGQPQTGGEVITIRDAAPTIDPTSTSQGITIDKNYIKNIPVPGRTFEATTGAAAGAQKAETITTTGSHRHGCAGCASSGRDGASTLLLVGLAFLGVSRRRRR